MNRGEYGDLRRYGTSKEDWPDDTDDDAVRRQRALRRRLSGGDPHWQAGTRQPSDGWSTSPASRGYPDARREQERVGERQEQRWGDAAYGEGRYGQYGEGRYRGMRPESQQRYVAPPRGPGRDSRGNWHQGGLSRYGDASTYADTLREEWGTGRRRQPVGPKGYQRSDARIQEDLCQQLAYSRFDVSEVEVTVAEGVVTLGGEVGERAEKYGIEEIADGVFGVRDVENQIRTPRAQGMP